MSHTLSDGSLITDNGIVRVNYAVTHRVIKSGQDLRATLRAGAHAWPGGYPIHLTMADGEGLCFACAHQHLALLTRALRDRAIDTRNRGDWLVHSTWVNYEDHEAACVQCNEHLEEAYPLDAEASA